MAAAADGRRSWRGSIEDYVREEVYYREALALGLDRDDTVIRRRLRQKMEFLGDAGAAALVADDAELRAYFEAHPSGSRRRARVTFRQVFLGEADPARGAGGAGGGRRSRRTSGTASLLPPTMEAAAGEHRWTGRSATASSRTVVGAAARRMAGTGRVGLRQPSGAGSSRRSQRSLPAFEEVRGAVEEDWRREKAAELGEAHYQALRRALRGGSAVRGLP